MVFHCFISGPAAQPDQMEKLLLLFAKPIPSHQLFSCSCNTVTIKKESPYVVVVVVVVVVIAAVTAVLVAAVLAAVVVSVAVAVAVAVI